MDHKHLIVTVVGDTVLLDDIAQWSKYIGHGVLVIPHVRMIARHLCLFGHHHGPTVALQAHTLACSEGLFHKNSIAD
jgi:hypothetical protein